MVEEGEPLQPPCCACPGHANWPRATAILEGCSCVDAGLHGVDSRLASLKC